MLSLGQGLHASITPTYDSCCLQLMRVDRPGKLWTCESLLLALVHSVRRLVCTVRTRHSGPIPDVRVIAVSSVP